MTELDKELQKMALMNWEQFVALIGEDAIKKAKVCILRKEGNKYEYISMVMKLSKNQVQYACSSCNSKS